MCDVPSTPADIESRLIAAERAFTDLDQHAFVVATDHVVLLEPCLEVVVEPQLAAHWHRVMALKLYGDSDESGAAAAMRAARGLDPAYVFPDELLPEGPLRALYDQAPTAGAARPVPLPREGSLAFDGTIGRFRPEDRATIAQRLDPAGRVAATDWLLPADPLMPYPVVPRTRRALWAGAGIATAGAVATFGGALAGKAAFETWTPDPADADPAASEAHLRALRGRANTLTTISITLGVVAVGGTVGAVAVGPR